MPATRDVLEFACTRDPWQQDLLRRVFTQPDLTDNDLEEVLHLLKDHCGCAEAGRELAPAPLTEGHVPHRPPEAPRVVLNSIEGVRNVNRLAVGQSLRFAPDGLTVVHGDNGSGKSGYCRILKKVCRVREEARETILGNAFEAAQRHPAEAVVRYTVGGGEPVPLAWTDGGPTPAELSLISVFDSKAVPIYADKENRLDFLPHSLDVLPRVGRACKKLGESVDQEIGAARGRIGLPLPIFVQGTNAAAVCGRLREDTPEGLLPSPEQIRGEGTWNVESARRLGELEGDLAVDPGAMARRCRVKEEALQRLAKEIGEAQRVIGTEAGRDLREKVEAAGAARAAADLAASEAFQDDPLPGVGSDPWRLMFQYAKEYSAIAYPGEPFPSTAEGNRCLLCQQLLGEAAERVRRFQTFVTGAAAAEAGRLEEVRDVALSDVIALRVRQPADVIALLAGIEEILPDGAALRAGVSDYFKALAARHRGLKDAASGRKPFEEVSDLPRDPSGELLRSADQLRLRAETDERVALDPGEREGRVRERENLKARKTLSENLQTVLQRREDLVGLQRLLGCKRACDTTQISRKNTDLRRRHLTEEFERRIRSEIEGLGLAALPLRVTDRSAEASSYVGLSLDTAVRVQNHVILSEGEFRALAVACFLAEVAGLPGGNGIVLDDPVSSLDHLRTERVAKRLVREARAGRQVIVFTHDLVFYHELLNAAAEADVPFVGHWVRASKQTGPGTVHEGEEPWQAKKVGKRLDAVRRNLQHLEQVERLGGEAYRAAVKDFYTDLRETWERLVEELLFDSAVCRYQREVKTQSLKGALVENDDYRKVFFGMRRASRFSGHDAAAGQQIEMPTVEEIRSDLRGLDEYAQGLATRRKRLREERAALERPPRAELV